MRSLPTLLVTGLMWLPMLVAAPAWSHGLRTPDGIAPQFSSERPAAQTRTSALHSPTRLQPATSTAATPLTTHPRLWLTSADLPRLRSWAVSTNPMYLNGLLAAANLAETDVNAK